MLTITGIEVTSGVKFNKVNHRTEFKHDLVHQVSDLVQQCKDIKP